MACRDGRSVEVRARHGTPRQRRSRPRVPEARRPAAARVPTPPPDSRELVKTLSINVGVAFSRPADLPRWIQLDFATSAWAVRSPSKGYRRAVHDRVAYALSRLLTEQ